MKKDKMIWVIVSLTILLSLGSIMAFDFDNIKSYDQTTQTITIKNAFGLPLIGNDLAYIKLNTPTDYKVGAGYQKIAEMEFTSYDDFKGYLINNNFELIDLNTAKQTARQLDFKYSTNENVLIDDYSESCITQNTLKNGTDIKSCSQILKGNHLENQEVWKDISQYSFKSGEPIKIGIFTDVQIDDKVEWIPNLYGVKITEWATWTNDLNVGLVAYYTLNNTASVVDSSGNGNTGTNNGATNTSGILGSAYNYTGTQWTLLPNMSSSFKTTATFNAWILSTGIPTTPWDLGNSSAGESFANGGLWYTEIFRDDRVSFAVSVSDNTYVMTTITQQTGVNGYKAYINGISVYNNTGEPAFNMNDSTGRSWQLGRTDDSGVAWIYHHGKLDEVSFWNRSLTQAEVTQLYNGGAGITWQANTTVPQSLTITLTSPDNNTNFSTNNINLVGDVNLTGAITIVNVSLLINGTINQTNSSGLIGTYNFSNVLGDGAYNWTIISYGNNSARYNASNGTLNFIVDTIKPIFTITSPPAQIDYNKTNDVLNLNWSVLDTNLNKCWYNNNGTNVTLASCSSGVSNGVQLNLTSVFANNVTLYANDTAGNQNSTFYNWTWLVFENSRTFNATTIEGMIEGYVLTFVSPSNQDVYLSWDGTLYSSTVTSLGSNTYNATNTLTIPNTSGAKTLFWVVNVNSSSQINTTSSTQTITAITLDSCGANTRVLLNYSLMDEESQTLINTTLNPSIVEVDMQLTNPSNSSSIYVSFASNFTNNNNPRICISPYDLKNLALNLETITKYSAISYEPEFSNLQVYNVTNTTIPKYINLSDLNSSSSTDFLITLKGNNSLALSNALINLTRKYIFLGEYRSVEIPTTDSYGQTKLHLDTDNVIYRILVEKDGSLLGAFDVTPICENILTQSCNINLNLATESLSFPDYNTTTDLIYSAPYLNQTTRNITFTYTSLSGNSHNVTIQGLLLDGAGNTSLCYSSLVSSAGTLTCHVPVSYGNATLIYKISKDGTPLIQGTFNISPTPQSIFGATGTVLVILLMLTIILMFIGNPIGMVLGVILGFVLSGALLLLGVGSWVGTGSVIIWFIIAGGILIWKIVNT